MRKILTAIVMFISLTATAQQIQLKKGEIYNSNDEKLKVRQVQYLLADQPELLKKYNTYHNKSILGGLLLGGGAGLLVTDLALGFYGVEYPTAATIIGAPMLAASIPVLIGRRKKINEVVEEYNRGKQTTATGFKVESLHVIANQNGAGVRVTF